MAATTHALLGPSGSHRWMHCTPSARLEEHVSDKGSDFAQEGSCAHALCEELLWTLIGDEQRAAVARSEQEANDRQRWFSTEMQDSAEDYVSAVWGKYQEALKTTPDARLFVERRLSFEQWIPESFGTADAVIIADGMMEVVDFKYGKGVEVSAYQNPQMLIYALGALAEFEDEYDIRNVRVTIIQPRIRNYSEYEITEQDLKLWGAETLRPAAAKAFKGEGEQLPGEWCRFCKIRATCAALANQAIAAYTKHEDKTRITTEEMPALLSLLPAIKTWCSAVEDYATAQALHGVEYEGYKIVAGRSTRKVADEEALIGVLTAEGYTADDLFKPAELKTLTELERLVGKKRFASLSSGLICKPEGKPALVPNSDKRAPLSVNTAAEDFKDIQ